MRLVAAVVAVVVVVGAGCATVQDNLRAGDLYEACNAATNGQFFWEDGTDDERELVRRHIEDNTVVEVTPLSFSDEAWLGEPLLHDEFALIRIRVQLPPGTSSRSADDDDYDRLSASDLAASLPPLFKPTPEIAPIGPLVIPPPPENAPYKAPKRPKRRRKGLIDAFVSLMMLPGEIVKAGVEATVAVIRIPFDILNGVLSSGRVASRPLDALARGPTPAHSNPMFDDALLEETEWRRRVDVAAEKYDARLAEYESKRLMRNKRIEALMQKAERPCELSGGSCDVIRLRRRQDLPKGRWFSLRFPVEVAGTEVDASCYVPVVTKAVAALTRPNPYRRQAPEMTPRKWRRAEQLRQKPKAQALRKNKRFPHYSSSPAFLWSLPPPSGLARAFVEAPTKGAGPLENAHLICRVDVKHSNRWNEPRGPDPIVRLTWGLEEPVGSTSLGPDDSKRFFFVTHDVSLSPGDRIRITLGDRDGSNVEYMGIAVADFDGTMPLRFDLSTYKAECRAMSDSVYDRRSAKELAASKRRLERLEAAVESAKISTLGDGYPTKARDRFDKELKKLASWRGAHHGSVVELLNRRTETKLRLERRVAALRIDAATKATPLTTPEPLNDAYTLVELKSLCAPTAKERDRIDFFVPKKLESELLSRCLVIAVVEGTRKWSRSLSRGGTNGFQLVAADGSIDRSRVAIIGDHSGWFGSKSANKGRRIVALIVPGESEPVFQLPSGKMVRPRASEESSLDPVTLGASPAPVKPTSK